MTTVIINEKTKKGKIIIELIRETGIGKILEKEEFKAKDLNLTTIQAIEEAKSGNTIKCSDFNDYLSKVK